MATEYAKNWISKLIKKAIQFGHLNIDSGFNLSLSEFVEEYYKRNENQFHDDDYKVKDYLVERKWEKELRELWKNNPQHGLDKIVAQSLGIQNVLLDLAQRVKLGVPSALQDREPKSEGRHINKNKF